MLSQATNLHMVTALDVHISLSTFHDCFCDYTFAESRYAR